MQDSVSRYEDMGDGLLSIEEEDGIIKVMTIPPIESITFTGSGGQSINTLQALRKQFCEMMRDNEETPQKGDIIDDSDCQSRREDSEKDYPGFLGQMCLSKYGDVKVTILSEEPLVFKSPENGGTSKHTYQAMIDLMAAMKQDNKEKPQSRSLKS